MSNRLSGQSVVVTGGSGFLGAHLCRALGNLNCSVHSMSRHAGSAAGSGVHPWTVDLAETAAVRETLAAIRPDVIFHLASHVEGSRNLDRVNPTFRNNLASTVNLLTAAAETGCRRILLTGSLEEPDPQDGEPVPCSPYAAAKWAASSYGRMFHALYGLPVVLLRVFMVYGPGQSDLRKLVPYVILSLLKGEPPKLSSGQRLVDWIYVEDVVEGLLAAAQAPGVEGRTIDIGSGKLVTVREVASRLSDLIQPSVKPLFGALGDRPHERIRKADISRTKRTTGWAPRVRLDDGLKRTANWYENHLERQLPRSQSAHSLVRDTEP